MPKFLEYCFKKVSKLSIPFDIIFFILLAIVWSCIVIFSIVIPIFLFVMVVAAISPNSKCAAESLGSNCHYDDPRHAPHNEHDENFHYIEPNKFR